MKMRKDEYLTNLCYVESKVSRTNIKAKKEKSNSLSIEPM